MIKQPLAAFPERKVIQFTWANMTDGDTGGEINWINFADRSVQVFGAFGQVTIEGSNNGTDWATLRNASGDSLVMTSAKVEQVLEVCLYVRPVVTGVGSNISIVMVGKES